MAVRPRTTGRVASWARAVYPADRTPPSSPRTRRSRCPSPWTPAIRLDNAGKAQREPPPQRTAHDGRTGNSFADRPFERTDSAMHGRPEIRVGPAHRLGERTL